VIICRHLKEQNAANPGNREKRRDKKLAQRLYFGFPERDASETLSRIVHNSLIISQDLR
jgi:hypothetical protein